MQEVTSEIVETAIAWRRHLHRNPELAYQEHATSAFIADRLTEFGYDVHRGLAQTGVVGSLTKGKGGPTLAIRADMDALPIREQTDTPYESSNPGVMHACGHDGHVAMALAAARACTQIDFRGTLRFIFQPAEEAEGGGKRMVEEGLFRLFPCEAIYAFHNWPKLPVGSLGVRAGPVLAAFGLFEIKISGQSCHGAFPHEGTDTLLTGCNTVVALQSIVSRNVDPRDAAVVSATQLQTGDTWNALSENCIIRGTTRWFREEVGDLLERRLREIAEATSRAGNCEAAVRYERRYPATVNNDKLVEIARDVAKACEVVTVDQIPSTGAEDFSFMAQEVPGCYLLLGAGRHEDAPPLHSSRFDFNDELIRIGARFWVSLVKRHLSAAGYRHGRL